MLVGAGLWIFVLGAGVALPVLGLQRSRARLSLQAAREQALQSSELRAGLAQLRAAQSSQARRNQTKLLLTGPNIRHPTARPRDRHKKPDAALNAAHARISAARAKSVSAGHPKHCVRPEHRLRVRARPLVFLHFSHGGGTGLCELAQRNCERFPTARPGVPTCHLVGDVSAAPVPRTG